MFSFIKRNKVLGGLGGSAIGLTFMLPILVGYHLRILTKNRTTNEEMKTKKLEYGLKN